MRSRLTLLVVTILVVAGFAALNWSEFVRPTELLFGPIAMDAPLGLIMLGLLVLTLLFFLVSTSVLSTRYHNASHHHLKTLEAQRELADKAEASRFTELRQHLDTQLRELRQRDAIAATEFEKAMVQGQRELRTQLEQMNRTVAARLGELEHRLDARLDRVPGVAAAPVRPAAALPSEAAVREAHLREEQAREERLQHERAHAVHHAGDARVEGPVTTEPRAGDQPGWRRWF